MNNEAVYTREESMLDKAIAWQCENLEDLRAIRADIHKIADALAVRAPVAEAAVPQQGVTSAGKLVKLRDTQDDATNTVQQIKAAVERLRELL